MPPLDTDSLISGNDNVVVNNSINASEVIDTTSYGTKKDENNDSNNNDDGIPGQTKFFWSTEDEPHAERRKIILAKFPEIKQLYGYDPILKYQVTAVVVLQIGIAIAMSIYKPSAFVFIVTAYCIGGTCNHMMFMALHELAHNLGFKYQPYNKYFGMFVANLPLGIPATISFKRYHMEHHRYQGVDGIDVDIPTQMEGKIFNTTISKFFFVIFQLLFYAFRPYIVNYKQPTDLELINTAAIIVFDSVLTYCTGSIRPLGYLLLSTLLGGGLHPCAGHFIAEHYVFNTTPGKVENKHMQYAEAETYSYYGPLNYLTFNVGYHNEHHDFPFIPGRRLPKVRQIASEFYDSLPYHTSWCAVLYNYITQANVTGFSRVKRTTTSALEQRTETTESTTTTNTSIKKKN